MIRAQSPAAIARVVALDGREKHAAYHRIEAARAARRFPAADARSMVRRVTKVRAPLAPAGARGRCTETGRLEFHHILPFARGGPSTIANIALRCRAHNAFEGERDFGFALR